VRKARKDQGILIASGLMAGAAISGILSAVLRMKEIGAPVRFLSIGREFTLKDGQLVHTDASWYATSGLLAGVILIIALAVICFLVARYGARSVLAGEAMARQGIPPTEDPELGEEADPEDLFGDLDRDEEEDPGEEDDRY
jgi:hypothetical protein